jgi:3-phosphoshikimate 1-carboxyvinyltransferase
MTLKWLDEQGVKYIRDGYSYFKIFPNQTYRPFDKTIPADWSSAAFPICAAAVTVSDVLIKGIDMNDVQGDKVIIDYLKSMGTNIAIEPHGIRINGKNMEGKDFDINSTPDALPALAAIGCYANGKTELFNVAQARVKETDRIKVMAQELKKMGADIEELPEGLKIRKSALRGTHVNGHNDHRVVMALSIAGLTAEGKTIIDTAEAVAVTYPDFVETMQSLGAKFKLTEEVN